MSNAMLRDAGPNFLPAVNFSLHRKTGTIGRRAPDRLNVGEGIINYCPGLPSVNDCSA
jgi:hypothetical protein